MFKKILMAAALVGLASWAIPAANAQGATASATFDWTIPANAAMYVHSSTSNSGSFGSPTITYDSSNHFAQGSASIQWDLFATDNDGVTVGAWVSGMVSGSSGGPGANPAGLENDISLTCTNTGSGTFTVSSPFGTVDHSTTSGVLRVAANDLGNLPQDTAGATSTTMGVTSAPGTDNFTTTLNLYADPLDGNGIVTGVLNFVVSANP